jgi:PAS domain S-box-containing protein
MKRVVSEQRGYSGLVNLAGHQVGLSNRIAHFVSLMVTTDNESEYDMARAQVGRAINQMKLAHDALRKGDPGSGIPFVINDNLLSIYEDPMVGLDLAVKRYLERARDVYNSNMAALNEQSAAYLYITTYGPHVLDPMLDAAVDEYEKIGRDAIYKIERFELIIWFLTIVVLLLELRFIFIPLERHVQKTLRSLESSVEELTNTRTRLQAAQKLAQIGDWELQLRDSVLTWSDQIYEICGVSQEDFTATFENALELVHPEDRELVKSILKSVIRKKNSLDFECRIIRPDGTKRLVYQHVTAGPGESGPVEMLSGTMQDITERKELSSRFEKLSAQIPGFICQFHLDSGGSPRIAFASKGIIETCGIEPDQVDKNIKSICSLFHEEDVTRLKERIKESSESLTTWHGQYRFWHPVKGLIWLEGHATPESLNDGGARWYGYFWDITERKNSEAEKERLRTQLEQSQKMEALGILAGGIAHDFNNILSAIMGYTELSKIYVSEEMKAVRCLDEVMKAGSRAKDLVQQILTFSRQTERELKPVSVKHIAEEALRLIRASLPSTIEIRQSLKSDMLVMGDPTQIHQMIMNLCTNAGHAMMVNGGILMLDITDLEADAALLALHPELEAGSYLKLTVSDTGHGVQPEVAERIFDPFFTTKPAGKGTGMGLAVVHGLVKSYGGAIKIESEPEKGARFEVYLPSIENGRKMEIQIEKSLPRGFERILFVDDEPNLVEIGQSMLENLGYQVITRTSSLEALKLFKKQADKFDLVITDMTMPQMTGDKLAREVLAVRCDVPIIICTGFSKLINEKNYRTKGVKGLLMKPVVMSEMAKMVRQVLNESRKN